jgi:hypothetical protein
MEGGRWRGRYDLVVIGTRLGVTKAASRCARAGLDGPRFVDSRPSRRHVRAAGLRAEKKVLVAAAEARSRPVALAG